MRIADEIRLPEEKRSSLYFALLLKDVGWSSNATRMCEIDRIARIIRNGVTQHANNEEIIGLRCDRGASIVSKLGLGVDTAEAVRSLDEHWDGDGYPDSLKGEQISLLARICAVAQHLDVFSAGRGIQAAMSTLVERSGTWFDPELVRVAVSLQRRGTLWANCLATDSQATL